MKPYFHNPKIFPLYTFIPDFAIFSLGFGIWSFGLGFSTAHAQPFTKNYIMTFHTCDAACTGFQDHKVNLAESDDGASWSLVPNFTPYSGSVPDVIVRGNKLYLFTPGKVRRYDYSMGQWDANPVNVSMVDSNSNFVSFVDPSPIIDSNGRIALFFLNSTGSTGDPAGCPAYPCTKYFDSSVEVDGSDGTQFVLQNGHRLSVTLNTSPQTASDPDIYFNGSEYILYISKGSSVTAHHSSSLHGSYSSFPNLTNDLLTNQGGIPCGIYNDAMEYYTYVHANVAGNTVIRQAIHTGFTAQLTNFTTVISGPLIGEPATTKTESPGICTNDFLTVIRPVKNLKSAAMIIQKGSKLIFQMPGDENYRIEIFDIMGRVMIEESFDHCFITGGMCNINIFADELSTGIYCIRIIDTGNIIYKGNFFINRK